MPMQPLPPKVPPTNASNEDAREALVPVRARMRDGQLIGLVDQLGNDLGLPITAKSTGGSDGGIEKPLTAAVIDDSGRVAMGVDAVGGLVVPGAPGGLQNAALSQDAATAILYQIAGDNLKAKLYLDRARHTLRKPVFFSKKLADITLDNCNQRMPASVLLRRDGHIAKVLCLWEQVARPNGGSDSLGVRLIQSTLTVDLAQQTIDMGPISIFEQPAGWAPGVPGMVSGPELIKLASGRIICIYISGIRAPGTALHIWKRHSDDDGATWSAATKIFDASTSFTGDWGPSFLATGSGGHILQLASGRLVSSIWTAISSIGKIRLIYSDNGGDTWTAGPPIDTGALYGNEHALALMSDGTIVLSIRQEGATKDICATSTDGATLTYVGQNDNFVSNNCGRSMVRAGDATTNGPEKIIWSGCIDTTISSHADHVVRVSFDGLQTWQHQFRLVDAKTRGGYSCIVSLGDGFYFIALESGFNDYCVMNAFVFNMAWGYSQ